MKSDGDIVMEQHTANTRRYIGVPGEIVAEGENVRVYGQGVVKIGDKYVITVTSLVEVHNNTITVIPLEGPYMPKAGDVIIGIIEDIGLTAWILDIKSPYKGVLHVGEALSGPFNPLKNNLRRYFDIGDYVIAKILDFDKTKDPVLTVRGKGLGKITRGIIVEVSPPKVPRIIGKKGSMISMIKGETGCNIVVGMNGRILVNCSDPRMANIIVKAIKIIERESHTTGLTDRIRMFIQENKEVCLHELGG